MDLLEWNMEGNMTQESYDGLLAILSERLRPVLGDRAFPASFKASMKYFNCFQVKYDEIHICPNGCCRYDGSNQFLGECPSCEAPRYESGKAQSTFYRFPMHETFRRKYMHPQDSADMQAHARHVPWEESGKQGMEKMWGAYQTLCLTRRPCGLLLLDLYASACSRCQ
jgi:hypothetical protein